MNILEEIIAYKKSELDKASSYISLDDIKKKIKSVEREKRSFYQSLKDKKDKMN